MMNWTKSDIRYFSGLGLYVLAYIVAMIGLSYFSYGFPILGTAAVIAGFGFWLVGDA